MAGLDNESKFPLMNWKNVCIPFHLAGWDKEFAYFQ